MKLSKIKTTTALSVILIALFMFNSNLTYAWKSISGNGNVIKQDREISSFTGIEVGGAFHVFLTQGDKESLTVEADENLLEIIETRVRGGVLEIETTENIRDSKALNLYITFKDLDNLDISGACQLNGENKFKLKNLELECSGASDVSIKISAGAIDMDCSGASQIDLFGTAESVNLDLSGASQLDAVELEIAKGTFDISGASHAKVFVTSELKADVSGAGSLKYKGDAKLVEHDVSGAGSIKKI